MLNAAQRLESDNYGSALPTSQDSVGAEGIEGVGRLVGVGPKVGKIALGPKGPETLSMLDAFAFARLCLTTWRGKCDTCIRHCVRAITDRLP